MLLPEGGIGMRGDQAEFVGGFEGNFLRRVHRASFDVLPTAHAAASVIN